MSERRSFERRSEWRSFFRERKVSAVLFRQKERKVSAAQKNGERERKTRSFLRSFFGDIQLVFPYNILGLFATILTL